MRLPMAVWLTTHLSTTDAASCRFESELSDVYSGIE